MIKQAINLPVTTTVGVLLLVLFGTISLFNIPVQLIPTVEEPIVTVTTVWPGASPLEVEKEIINEQEEQLKSLSGLVKMTSASTDSNGAITLEFQTGTDIDTALLRVANRLEQVPEYPDDVDKPIITTVDANASAMAWFVLRAANEDFREDISELFNFVEDFIKPEMERVPGVAQSNTFGGREQEMQVLIDPEKLSAKGITLNQVANALENENRNYSGGDFDEGKRRYIVRTIGEYTSPEDIENIVIETRNGVPLYLRDVARAQISYRKPTAVVYEKGETVIAMNAIRQQGANAIETMEGVKAAVARMNSNLLAKRNLRMDLVYDETDYIKSAVDLVQQSLIFGGILAVVVLLLFLRSFSSTLVIGVAIPISAIGTFLMMALFGRTLNVVSLAGMAFAIGMVVDNAIVVLENIYRHLQMGKSKTEAALDGASEVWGAVLASTLTTIAVFVPVLFVQEEAGQLFADISIAISCAVALSLLVSVTVIPSFSAKILGHAGKTTRGFQNLWGLVSLFGKVNDAVANTVRWICGNQVRALLVVLVMTGSALYFSWLLLPKAEYLPSGNQNFLFGIVLPPPGYSINEVTDMGRVYVDELSPHWSENQNPTETRPGEGIAHFFFVALPNQAFMGVSAKNPLKVRELLPVFMQANSKLPGTIAFTIQANIFNSAMSGGRAIDIEITGPDLVELIGLGGRVFGGVMQHIPGSQARPIPGLDLGNPEIRVVTHRQRAAEAGISNRELGLAVSALIDGVKVSDYRHEGDEIDLKLMAPGSEKHRTHLIEQMSVSTPSGEMVTLASLADVQLVNGPVEIAHRERQRAITIQVNPPEEMPLEEAMDVIQNQILKPMRDQGVLGGTYRAALSGTADKLTQTYDALKWNILLAIVITYLLLAALFESFLYPFVILFSVPLAAFGGFLGLKLVNVFLSFQAMDVLTMLGFIILIGTVVNNAILIVHQSLIHLRDEGAALSQAISTATRSRIRPIFMSVGTSVFGMLPLVLFPGAGSELYRGLGGVVVGGLVMSTIFTLFLVPAMLSLALSVRAWLASFTTLKKY